MKLCSLVTKFLVTDIRKFFWQSLNTAYIFVHLSTVLSDAEGSKPIAQCIAIHWWCKFDCGFVILVTYVGLELL